VCALRGEDICLLVMAGAAPTRLPGAESRGSSVVSNYFETPEAGAVDALEAQVGGPSSASRHRGGCCREARSTTPSGRSGSFAAGAYTSGSSTLETLWAFALRWHVPHPLSAGTFSREARRLLELPVAVPFRRAIKKEDAGVWVTPPLHRVGDTAAWS